MNSYQLNLMYAKDIIGSFDKLGVICGVTGKAVNKWYLAGKPPRTEYTGETNYAVLISNAVDGAVKPSDLIPSRAAA